MLRPPRRLRPSIPLLALVASLALAPDAAAAQTTDTSTFTNTLFVGRTSEPGLCAKVDIDASRSPEVPGTLTTRVFLSILVFEADRGGQCGAPPDDPAEFLRSLAGQAGGGAVQFRVAKNVKTASLSSTIQVTEDIFEPEPTPDRFSSNQVQVNLSYRCVERQERTRQRSRSPDGSFRTTTESVTCDAVATGSVRSPDPDTGQMREFVLEPSDSATIGRTVTRTVQRN
jgi:hypothetical protein